jgi:hypothetical protein
MRNAPGTGAAAAIAAAARVAWCVLGLAAAGVGLGTAGGCGEFIVSPSGIGGARGHLGTGGAVAPPGPDGGAGSGGTGAPAGTGGTADARDAAVTDSAPRPDAAGGDAPTVEDAGHGDAGIEATPPRPDAAGDGGVAEARDGDGAVPPPDGGPANGVSGIIGVGYGGIRIVSRDLGRTWSNETHWAASGGDDNNLLRTIAYGNGIWVSAGWRYVTSTDGVTWTDRGMAIDVIKAVRCDITDGMTFGAGRFLVACGTNLAWSSDGLTWTKIGTAPDVMKHQTLVFDPGTGRFGLSGDNNASFVSSDGGQTWTSLAGVSHVRLCRGALRAESDCPAFFASDGTSDTFLGTVWAGTIRRSTDGTKWSNVYNDPSGNTLFTDYAFAVGVVAPR